VSYVLVCQGIILWIISLQTVQHGLHICFKHPADRGSTHRHLIQRWLSVVHVLLATRSIFAGLPWLRPHFEDNSRRRTKIPLAEPRRELSECFFLQLLQGRRADRR